MLRACTNNQEEIHNLNDDERAINAKAYGLSGADAHSWAVTDTSFDITITTTVQTGLAVVGTAIMLIMGVGTAL